MSEDTQLPFAFPAVAGKKVTAAFDGGRISSDGGVLLLAQADRRLGLLERMAALLPDRRNPAQVTHRVADILRARVFSIACGYEDGNDLGSLRVDPALKLACGRLPDSGADLCSQPTLSRWENVPRLRDLIRLGHLMIDQFCASYGRPPKALTLDIDDTVDVVHGRQQLSLFNAHHDEYCFQPIHIYDVETGRPLIVILRPGKTPSGVEIRNHLRRLVRRLRHHWPATRLTIRGDSHYCRPEVIRFCEACGIDYVLGFSGTKPLKEKVAEVADSIRTERAEEDADVVRGYTEVQYKAGSWPGTRRMIARIEATRRGLDQRFVVTSLSIGSAEWIYDSLYCARGQAENLIKLHKTQLASDRTSCRSPLANQMRLFLHTAAYWLVLTVRDAIPATDPLASAEFTTLQLRLFKVAVRIAETATRIRLAFAAGYPEAALFRGLVNALRPAPA